MNNLGGSPAGPIAFNAGSTGLLFTFTSLADQSDDVDFSNNGGSSWTYVPQPDGAGIDTAVTHIRLRPRGAMAAGATFTVQMRTRIK